MGTVEDQAARHAEAYRRANPTREIPAGSPPEGAATGAGLQIGDMWSSGGAMPGVTTPDDQGPEPPLGPPITESPRIDIGGRNTEDIISGVAKTFEEAHARRR
jgi:hypothetical protein